MPLTPSELRSVDLLAHGYGTKEIARKLSIAPKAVGTHTSNVMRKFEVESRTQAVIAAQLLGLVDLGADEVEGHNHGAAETGRPALLGITSRAGNNVESQSPPANGSSSQL